MPNQPKTPTRSIRIPDNIWQAALKRAAEREETVSQQVVKFLTRYGK